MRVPLALLVLGLAVRPLAAQPVPPLPVAGAGAPSAEAERAQAEGLFIHALGLAYLGSHDEAAETLTRVLALRPQDPGVHDALSESLAALGRDVPARYHAEQAHRLAPGEPAFAQRLAGLQLSAGQADAARRTLETLLTSAPRDTEALASLAGVYVGLGLTGNAEAVLLRLVDIGDTPGARLALADVARRRGDRAAALGHLERADRLAPGEPSVRAALAEALADAGRGDEARALVDALLDQNPGYPDGPRLRARLGAGRGAEASAQGPGVRATPLTSGVDPASPSDRLGLAREALERADEDPAALDEALRLARLALDATPAQADALALAGTAAFRAGRYAEAADLLGEAVEADPRLIEAWGLALTARLRAGDVPRAAALAEDAGLLFPGLPALAAPSAEVLVRADRAGEARRLAQEALAALDADGDPAPTLRGRLHAVLVRTGSSPSPDLAQARRLLGPEHPLVLEAEGDLARAAGRAAEARALYARALALDPGNASLQALAAP